MGRGIIKTEVVDKLDKIYDSETFFDMSIRDQDFIEGLAIRRFQNDMQFQPADADRVEEIYRFYIEGLT